ncbi:hypothetical protein [Haloarchaeobius amylolyticus]|uniref:hypothetical protein n=1 Tax=Haloarchaeobius amylolyticus TaxID=1198296 RepID=UPI00226D889D|nr:hypothetical protein [Haloarchaeobius amylolyticus]
MPAGCQHCGRRLVPVGVHTTVVSPPITAGGGSEEEHPDESIPAGEREELRREVVDLAERTVVVRAVALRPDDPEPVVAEWCPDASCPGQREAREAVTAHLAQLAETYRE